MEDLIKQIVKFYATILKAFVITGAIVAIIMLITIIMQRCVTLKIQQNVQDTEIPKHNPTSK